MLLGVDPDEEDLGIAPAVAAILAPVALSAAKGAASYVAGKLGGKKAPPPPPCTFWQKLSRAFGGRPPCT